MLTRKQISSITVNAIAVKLLITFPHTIIEVCKTAAWLAAVYCSFLIFLIFLATVRLYHSDRNVIGLAEKLGGIPLRIVTGMIVFLSLFANYFTLVRIFPEVVRLVLLQTTYVELIGLLFAVCTIFGAYCGPEAIARITEMLLPSNGFTFAAFILLLIPTMNTENIFPLLGSGAHDIFLGSIPFLSVFSDLLLLNLLIPYMKDRSDYRRAGIRTAIFGGMVASLVITAYCFSYVYPITKMYLLPVYQLERLIHLGSFFSRLEAVFQFIWSIAIMLYASLYLFVLAEVWKETFGLKTSKPLLAPIMLSAAGAAFIPADLSAAAAVEAFIGNWLYIPALGLPLIFGLITKMFHVKQ